MGNQDKDSKKSHSEERRDYLDAVLKSGGNSATQQVNIQGARVAFRVLKDGDEGVGAGNRLVPETTQSGAAVMAGLSNSRVSEIGQAVIARVQTSPDPLGIATMAARVTMDAMQQVGSEDILDQTMFQPGPLFLANLFDEMFSDIRSDDERRAHATYALSAFVHVLPAILAVRQQAASVGVEPGVENLLQSVSVPSALAEVISDSILDIVLPGQTIQLRPYGELFGSSEALCRWITVELATSDAFTRLNSSPGKGGSVPLSGPVLADCPTLTGDDARAALAICLDEDEDEDGNTVVTFGHSETYGGLPESLILQGAMAGISDDAFRKLCMAGAVVLEAPRDRRTKKVHTIMISEPYKRPPDALLSSIMMRAAGAPLTLSGISPEFDETYRFEIEAQVAEWLDLWEDVQLPPMLDSLRWSEGYAGFPGAYTVSGPSKTPLSPEVINDLLSHSGGVLSLGNTVSMNSTKKVFPIATLIASLSPKA